MNYFLIIPIYICVYVVYPNFKFKFIRTFELFAVQANDINPELVTVIY